MYYGSIAKHIYSISIIYQGKIQKKSSGAKMKHGFFEFEKKNFGTEVISFQG